MEGGHCSPIFSPHFPSSGWAVGLGSSPTPTGPLCYDFPPSAALRFSFPPTGFGSQKKLQPPHTWQEKERKKGRGGAESDPPIHPPFQSTRSRNLQSLLLTLSAPSHTKSQVLSSSLADWSFRVAQILQVSHFGCKVSVRVKG